MDDASCDQSGNEPPSSLTLSIGQLAIISFLVLAVLLTGGFLFDSHQAHRMNGLGDTIFSQSADALSQEWGPADQLTDWTMTPYGWGDECERVAMWSSIEGPDGSWAADRIEAIARDLTTVGVSPDKENDPDRSEISLRHPSGQSPFLAGWLSDDQRYELTLSYWDPMGFRTLMGACG